MKFNMNREIGDSIQDFELGPLLGIGAFATVHKATCLKQGSFKDLHVAIKKIRKINRNREDLEKRVRQEIQIHSSLDHPSIIKFYTSFEDCDFFYLVLELCPNGSLDEYLKNNQKPFSEDEAREILKPVIQGVIYMHRYKIIHRDLTLRNLLLTQDMQVKIADFGLAAKLLCPDEKKHTMLGTANFMSPEVATRTPHDLATDCWGLGCILYNLLTGKPPFDNGGIKRTLTDIVMSDYKLPEYLSNDAKHLISSLLKKNPDERIKIDGVLRHPFFTNVKMLSISSSHYSQKTIDSGLGSTGLLSSAASSVSAHSRYRSSSVAKRSLDTIPASGYSYHSDDSSSEIYDRISSYQVPERDNRRFTNRYPRKINERKYENSSVRQLKHKITTLPSKQYDFTRTCPDTTPSHAKINGHVKGASEEIQPLSCGNREGQSGMGSRSRSQSPIMHCDRNNCCSEHHGEGNLCKAMCRNCSDGCPGHRNTTSHHHNSCCSQRSTPPYHNPRDQCIDNHHRGNSRSPTRSPVSNQICHNSDPCASGRASCKCCNNTGHDYLPHQKEQIVHLPIVHQDKGYRENHTHHPPVNSCSHDRFCTDENPQCSHISACDCHRKKIHSVTDCERSSNCTPNYHKNGDAKLIPQVVSLRQSVPPLNSSRLMPRKQHGKNSVISILKDGDVCLEFLREKRNKKVVSNVFRISKDGMWVTVYKPSSSSCAIGEEPPAVPESGADSFFSYESLPEQHWKKYIYASRFVNYVRAKTAKITFYGTTSKGVMMENIPEPDFEVTFYEGGKVKKSQNGIVLVTKAGRMYSFSSEEEVKNLIDDADDMWKDYLQIHDTLLTLEKSMESTEETIKSLYPEDPERSCFPAVLGRRPHKLSTTQDNNKENNTPLSVRSSNVKATSILSYDGTISTNYSPSECYSETKRPSSQISVKRNSAEYSRLPREVREILPKVNHLSKDKDGNFCMKYKDGVELYSSKALTGIHIFDKVNGKRYERGANLPHRYQEKLCEAAGIALHLEEQRNFKTGR